MNNGIQSRTLTASCAIASLLCIAAMTLLLRRGKEPESPPPIKISSSGRAIVKPITGSGFSASPSAVEVASGAVAAVCGNAANDDRYEARNDALLSIARRRDLPKEEVAALMAYLRSTNDLLRMERVAALKNDVMNLLRRQETPVEGLAETLIAMFDGGAHPPAVLDYCIQHLGAMQGGIGDGALRARVHGVLVKAARRKSMPYAGTALYSLAADRRATPQQLEELKRLTLALCAADANTAARIAAIQLVGERGYGEALPVLRKELSSPRRDAVLDIVAIGSVGLLGDSSDIPRLSHFIKHDSRRAPAAEAAIRRINERSGVK